MTGDTVYVVDLYEGRFRYVSPGHLFLCGHSSEVVQQLGYRFYFRVVHPDDLPLLRNIYRAVYMYFQKFAACLHDLEYISFNFRISHHETEQMVCQKVVPLQPHCPQMVVCAITESVREEPGNLTAYYKDKPFRMDYAFEKQEWEEQPVIRLTPQEKKILKLAKQGKSAKEAADILNLTEQSVRNLKYGLFRKLNVNSIHQAIIFARNHHLDLS